MSNVTFKKMSPAEFDAALLSTAKAINSQDEMIQQILLNAVYHIEHHRNPTKMNQFFMDVKRSGVRIVGMKRFLLAFANVKLVDIEIDGVVHKDLFKVKPKRSQATFEKLWNGHEKLKPNLQKGALNTIWTEFKSEADVKSFDFAHGVTAIKRLMARFQNSEELSLDDFKKAVAEAEKQIEVEADEKSKEQIEKAAKAAAETSKAKVKVKA